MTFPEALTFDDVLIVPNRSSVLPTETDTRTRLGSITDFVRGLDCAKDYLGKSIKRNTCSNDWYFDLDLRVAQDIPGPASLAGIGGIREFAVAP